MKNNGWIFYKIFYFIREVKYISRFEIKLKLESKIFEREDFFKKYWWTVWSV